MATALSPAGGCWGSDVRPIRPPPPGSPVRRGRLAGDQTGTDLSASVPRRPAGLRDQGGASGQSETLVTAGPRLSQFWSRTFSIPHGVPDSGDCGSLAAGVCGWRWVGTVTGLRGSSRGVLTSGQGGASPPPLPPPWQLGPSPASELRGRCRAVRTPSCSDTRPLSVRGDGTMRHTAERQQIWNAEERRVSQCAERVVDNGPPT